MAGSTAIELSAESSVIEGLRGSMLPSALLSDFGDMIAEVLDALARSGLEQDVQAEERVAEQVNRLVSRFPIYEG